MITRGLDVIIKTKAAAKQFFAAGRFVLFIYNCDIRNFNPYISRVSPEISIHAPRVGSDSKNKQKIPKFKMKSIIFYKSTPLSLLHSRNFFAFFAKILPEPVRRECVSLCDCASHRLRNYGIVRPACPEYILSRVIFRAGRRQHASNAAERTPTLSGRTESEYQYVVRQIGLLCAKVLDFALVMVSKIVKSQTVLLRIHQPEQLGL